VQPRFTQPFLGWFPANLRKKARSWQGRICMPKNAHKKSFSDHNCGCNEPSSTTMSLWEFRNPQVMIQIPSLCSSKVSEPNHPFPWSESKRGQHQMSTPYKQTWQEQDHAKSEHQIGSIIVRKIDIVCLRPLITDIDMCSSWTYTEPIYAYIEYIHTYLYIHILQYINKYWTCKSKCIYMYMS
jgi:hypothetical protein